VSLGSIEVEEIASGSLRFGLPRNATVSRLEMWAIWITIWSNRICEADHNQCTGEQDI